MYKIKLSSPFFFTSFFNAVQGSRIEKNNVCSLFKITNFETEIKIIELSRYIVFFLSAAFYYNKVIFILQRNVYTLCKMQKKYFTQKRIATFNIHILIKLCIHSYYSLYFFLPVDKIL